MSRKLRRYPTIAIHSKNILAKRLVNTKQNYAKVLADLNFVLTNFDSLWKDSAESNPAKKKHVRSAFGTKLGQILKAIDQRILAPHDSLVPEFIFGGISKKNHIQAVEYLRGKKHKRTLIQLDISRFFEQINQARVYHFFHNKAGCSIAGAKLLAELCCVNEGPKDKPGKDKVLARGFATSQRLAIWCNLDIFIRINELVQKKLKGHDPRITIFVDDIGISASRVPIETMQSLQDEVIKILNSSDPNQTLPVNSEKTKISDYRKPMEHLGLIFGKKGISFGKKTLHRRARVISLLKKASTKTEKRKLIKRKKSYHIYAKQIKNPK